MYRIKHDNLRYIGIEVFKSLHLSRMWNINKFRSTFESIPGRLMKKTFTYVYIDYFTIIEIHNL